MPLFILHHLGLNVFPVYNLNTGGGPWFRLSGLVWLRMHLQFRSHRHRWTPSLVQKNGSRLDTFFFLRDDPWLSILQFSLMSFATTFFIHWMSFIFTLLFTLIQFAQIIFIIRVDRLRTGAWENFFGNTVYGDWKEKFRRLACTITRCALEHFLIGHWLLRAHFLHSAHRRRNGDWRRLYSLGGAVVANPALTGWDEPEILWTKRDGPWTSGSEERWESGRSPSLPSHQAPFNSPIIVGFRELWTP